MRVFAALALALVLALPACGILQGEPQAPPLARALAAKQADAAQWERLGTALNRYRSAGLEAAIDSLQAAGPLGLREEVLIQDLRREHWEADALHRFYAQRELAVADALSAFLLARVTEDSLRRGRLLEQAKNRDPELPQVRVALLANEPFRVGEQRAMERLLGLLRDHPGLAEGWRLLRDFGPRYGRPDLAITAAELEPWCPAEDLVPAQLDQVRACLDAGRARRALEKLDAFALAGREADLLRASALAEVGRAPEAWELLRAMQDRDPHDRMVCFNLGLLARDYLAQPERAAAEFERFLGLAEQARVAGEAVDGFRVLQAKTWLRGAVPVGEVDAPEDAAE